MQINALHRICLTECQASSTPPLSVEQSQKLIHNVMNRPPEQRGHPTTQADFAQAQWVVREQVRKLESQKEPLNETQKKALADAKAALARVGAESDRGPTSQPITDDRSNAPAVKWIVPQQPHHLKPSMPYDANRKPRGSPKKLDKKDTDFHNERGVNGENEAANVLAQHGYDYEQIREANKSPDGKSLVLLTNGIPTLRMPEKICAASVISLSTKWTGKMLHMLLSAWNPMGRM